MWTVECVDKTGCTEEIACSVDNGDAKMRVFHCELPWLIG